MKELQALFTINKHPLFNNGFIKREVLGSETEQNPASTTLHSAFTTLKVLEDYYRNEDTLTEEQVEEAVSTIADICKILGYNDISTDLIKQVLNKENLH